jgi:hypothetical protein
MMVAHWWVMMEAGELHLGVTSAPVGGVPPLPHLLSMARHHPSGENTLWPDITQPTTRRNRRLKMQKSNPTKRFMATKGGSSADNDGTS